MGVRLYAASGVPLLIDAEDEEPVGYRRRLIGFRPIEERFASEPVGGSGDVRPSVQGFCSCGVEAEGIWVEGLSEEEQEDSTEIEAD